MSGRRQRADWQVTLRIWRFIKVIDFCMRWPWAAAAAAYRTLLEEQGCVVLSEKKNFKKKQTAFVFRAPRNIVREDLEEALEEQVSPELKGAVDWETN